MANPQLWLLGQDLIAAGLIEISSLPDVVERKGFYRESLVTNDYNFVCKNNDNYFTTGNPRSILNGINWLYANMYYVDENDNTTWSGQVIDINCNHRNKIATVKTRDNLYKYIKDYIEYESADWETASAAAQNIMSNQSFTAFNEPSFNDAHDYLDSLGAYLKCNINKSDKVTLFDALNNLGFYSCSDVYSHLGNVYFQTWREYPGGTSLRFNYDSDSRLKSYPIVSYLEREIINDYSIDYYGSGGTALTDATGGNIGSTSRSKHGTHALEPWDTGIDKQYTFKDATTAQAIGELYIKRSHNDYSDKAMPLIKVQFDVDIRYKEDVTLESYFKQTLPEEGWDDKVFEVMEFRRNEAQNNINIVGYEV